MYKKDESSSEFQRRYFRLSNIGTLQWQIPDQMSPDESPSGEAEGLLPCAGIRLEADTAGPSEDGGGRFGFVIAEETLVN